MKAPPDPKADALRLKFARAEKRITKKPPAPDRSTKDAKRRPRD